MLEFVMGASIGLAFLAGCFVGAWQQRQVGFSVKTHLDRLVAEVMKRKPGVAPPEQPPVAEWGVGARPIGVEHPSGPPKPMPEQLGRKDPMDWADKILSRTKRMTSD